MSRRVPLPAREQQKPLDSWVVEAGARRKRGQTPVMMGREEKGRQADAIQLRNHEKNAQDPLQESPQLEGGAGLGLGGGAQFRAPPQG